MTAIVAALAMSPFAGCARREVGATAQVDGVIVRRAVAWTMREARSATVGFELDVTKGPDTLVAVRSAAGRAALHESMRGGQHGMRELTSLPLAAGRTLVDGRSVHVMVQELSVDIPIGGAIPVELRFARSGTVRLDVPVLRFSEALTALGR